MSRATPERASPERASKERADEPRAEARDAREQSNWTWVIPVTLIALLVLLYFAWPGYRDFADRAYELIRSGDRQAIRDWVRGFGTWGPVTILALMIAQTLLAFIPSVLIMVVAVLAYGPWWGGLLAWAGLLAAAVVAWSIGKALGDVTVDRLIGHATEQKVERLVDRYGVWAIIAARVSPALSTDAISYVAGLVEMGFARFVGATAVGILPLVVLISFLGENIDRLKSGLLWVSVASVALFAAYVLWDRWRNGAHGDAEESPAGEANADREGTGANAG